MSSETSVMSSGLSAGQWVRQNGLGNPETVRQMLALVEQTWGVSLRAEGSSGRTITPGVDRILKEAFADAKAKGRPVLEMLQDLLRTSTVPAELQRLGTQRVSVSSVDVQLEERLTELLAGFEEQLGRVMAQHQDLLAEQRDLQRRMWNEQWAGALHKAETSFNTKLMEATEAYESSLVELQEQLASDGQSLVKVTQQVYGLHEAVTHIRSKLHDASWQSDEARELNGRAEKLLLSVEKLVKGGQQLAATQKQQQQQTSEGARQLLAQVKRWQYLVPAAFSGGIFFGFLLYSWLRRAFPTWLAQPRDQLIVMLVLLVLTVALGVLFWRDND